MDNLRKVAIIVGLVLAIAATMLFDKEKKRRVF